MAFRKNFIYWSAAFFFYLKNAGIKIGTFTTPIIAQMQEKKLRKSLW